jgi:hypothetical protein
VKAVSKTSSHKGEAAMKTLSMSKFHASLCAAVLAIASLSTTSYAQRTDTLAKVNVPFGFEFGSQHFVAGVYTVRMLSEHLLSINGKSNNGLALVMRDTNLKPSTEGKVIFRRYNDRFYLREVWQPNETEHLQCIKTKDERRAERTVLASNPVHATNVELALLETPR